MPTKLRLLIGFCLIWIYGCGNEEVPRDKNYAPKVSVFEAEADIVEPGSRVAIRVKAEDLEGDPITYRWQANGGKIHGDGNGATWIAPNQERNYLNGIPVTDDYNSNTSALLLYTAVAAAESPFVLRIKPQPNKNA